MRTILSRSPAFQTLVGAGDAVAALASIHYFEQSPTRPYAVVGLGADADRISELVAVDLHNFEDDGWIVIAADAPDGEPSESESNRLMWFMNLAAEAIEQFRIEGLPGNYGFRSTGPHRVEGPMLNWEKDGSDIQIPWVYAVWGVGWMD